MPRFDSPIDLRDLEIKNVKLHQWNTAGRPSTAQARIGYNTDLDCPEWDRGTGDWISVPIPRAPDFKSIALSQGVLAGSGFGGVPMNFWQWYIAAETASSTIYTSGPESIHVLGLSPAENTIIENKAFCGLFEGFLYGVSLRCMGFADDAPLNLNLGGKAYGNVIVKDTNGASYTLDVTTLNVAPVDISLTNSYVIVGNASNKGTAVARNTIPVSDWGAATTNIAIGGNRITGLADPVSDTDAATKQWTLGVIALGNAPKTAVRVSTTASLFGTNPYTYSGPSPRKLVGNSAGAFPAIDGVTLSQHDRILLRHETGANEKYNGVWTLSTVGDGSNPFQLTRGVEEDTDSEVTTGIAYFVTSGTLYGGTEWTLATAGTITLDTTALAFVQTGGSNAYVAGNGIAISGTTIHFGQSGSYTANTIPYASGAASIGFISAGSAYQSLRIPGGGGAPAFGAIDLSQSAATTGTLPANRGGTGNASYAVGDLLYASGLAALSRLAGVATGNALISGGVTTAPSWGKVGLSTHVSGTLPVANGGTGATTHTANGLLVGNGTSAVTTLSTGDTAAIVVTAAGGVPQWVVPPGSGDVTIAATGVMTIGSNKVSLGKLAQVTGPVVLGRSSGTGDPQALSSATLKTMLDLTGTNSGDQTITLTGDVTGSGTGSFATSIASGAVVEAKIGTGAVTEGKIGSNAVTNAKIRQGVALSLIGVAGSATANVADIAAGTVGSASANKIPRVNNAGDAIEFGAVNLASTNAVTGVLAVANGGTGTSTALLFPTVAGQVASIYKTGLSSGSTTYNVTNPFGNTDVVVQVWTAAGVQVFPDITRTSTDVVITFGATTAEAYRVMIVGNNLS